MTPKYADCPHCDTLRPIESDWTCCACGHEVPTQNGRPDMTPNMFTMTTWARRRVRSHAELRQLLDRLTIIMVVVATVVLAIWVTR